MLIIEVKNGEIEKSLKQLKKKFDKTKTLKELRNRKEYVKPSVIRRTEVNKAKFIQEKFGNNG
jgi:small subunit ribosomal protein S21